MKTSPTIRLFTAALLVAFGAAWTGSAIDVTYQVNMSIQTSLGAFNPGSDTVFVSGDLSSPDWLQTLEDGSTNYILTQSVGDPDVYEGTFAIDIAPGGWENHKFVINSGGSFSSLQWEGIDNRFFQVPAANTNLPVVFFENVNTLPSTRDVTFQVDMSVQMALGNFDPLNDFLDVAGGLNGWTLGVSTLTQSVADTNIWEGTFPVTGVTGAASAYKFVIASFSSGDVWENNGVGPNGPNGDREVVLAATNQTLPVVCFNNECSVPSAIPVTFQVNMAAQMAYGNFVGGANTVTAAGSFNNWDAVSFILTNDPGEPMVYKGTTDVTGSEGATVAWQYVIDAAVWEEAVGNRTFNLATNSQTLATAFWNNVDDLGAVTSTPVGANQVDVSWDPGILVGLQQSSDLTGAWADVPLTTGESNATVTLTTDETYFRLIGPVTP